MQERPGGGLKAPGQVRIGEPLQHSHTKGCRQRRAKNHGDFHRGAGEGDHGVHGQSHQRVQRRQHCQQPANHRAVAQRPRHGHAALRVALRQGSQRHEQQKGNLLDQQAQHQTQTPGVVDDQGIRGARPAGKLWRDEACQQAGGGDQKGQPERGGGVGNSQQGGDEAADPALQSGAADAGQEHQHDAQRQQRGQHASLEADQHAVTQPGAGKQRLPVLQGEGIATQRRQIAEGRQHSQPDPQRHGHRQQGNHQPRSGAQQHLSVLRSVPARPVPALPSRTDGARAAPRRGPRGAAWRHQGLCARSAHGRRGSVLPCSAPWYCP